jgi:hypothetical protein
MSHSFGGYNGVGGSGACDNIDPNDILSGSFTSPTFSNNFNSPNPPASSSAAFSSGSAIFGDDELLDGLNSPQDSHAILSAHDFRPLDMNNMAFSPDAYNGHTAPPGLALGHNHLSGYSNTPDGEPLQSPYQQSFSGGPFRQALGTSLHSPISYNAGSPHGQPESSHDGSDYLGPKQRRGVPPPSIQRKSSTARSPTTPKPAAMHGIPIGSHNGTGFGPQPIHTSSLHDKSSAPWMHTPGGSLGAASFGSGFSSPIQPNMMQMNEVMMKGGTSMPAKLNTSAGTVTTQDAKRRKRRESHNAVERRRRDNINERIQDLCVLLPTHRLDDEKIRKLIQNGTPLSPTLGGGSSKPPHGISSISGPGAKRAASVTVGNITTGLPVEDKDKGPNKGDILNGAVGWMRDLMWMLHHKLQQQDELANYIAELGGKFPFQVTDDERRMQSELSHALARNQNLTYSRTAGSSLRVPGHTDIRGDPIDGSNGSSTILEMGSDITDHGLAMTAELEDMNPSWQDNEYWMNQEEDTVHFKEEDEYGMDLTQ